ncbi:MAG: hypothetical protein AAF770_01505 [Bacteroidota bacterium]
MQPRYPNIPTKQQALACGLHDLANVWGLKYPQTKEIVYKYAQETFDFTLDTNNQETITILEGIVDELQNDIGDCEFYLNYMRPLYLKNLHPEAPKRLKLEALAKKKFEASSKKAISIIENAVKKIQKDSHEGSQSKRSSAPSNSRSIHYISVSLQEN